MAKADQLRALLKSYANSNDAQFYAVAMQIAASEARQGHGKFAEELRGLIDQAKGRRSVVKAEPIPLAKPRGELAEVLDVSYPQTKLDDMVLAEDLGERLSRVIREQKAVSVIRARGLSPRRKLLLVGKPGTGKTMTASALAGELGLPLFVVRLDGLVTKFMGETSAKLRLVFEAIARTRGVYLFDEFDSIGAERGLANDVGEIRRIVNSFLQMVEKDVSDSLIVAATNHIGLLDRALFRRFDDVLSFEMPDLERTKKMLRALLSGNRPQKIRWMDAARAARGLSFADVARAAEDAIKDALVDGREFVAHADLMRAIRERRQIVGGEELDG